MKNLWKKANHSAEREGDTGEVRHGCYSFFSCVRSLAVLNLGGYLSLAAVLGKVTLANTFQVSISL